MTSSTKTYFERWVGDTINTRSNMQTFLRHWRRNSLGAGQIMRREDIGQGSKRSKIVTTVAAMTNGNETTVSVMHFTVNIVTSSQSPKLPKCPTSLRSGTWTHLCLACGLLGRSLQTEHAIPLSFTIQMNPCRHIRLCNRSKCQRNGDLQRTGRAERGTGCC